MSSLQAVGKLLARAACSGALKLVLLLAIGGYAAYEIHSLKREVLERVDERMDRVDRRMADYDAKVRAYARGQAERVDRSTGELSRVARGVGDATEVAVDDLRQRDAAGREAVYREAARVYEAHEEHRHAAHTSPP